MLTVWNKEIRDRMNHCLSFKYKGDFSGGEKIKIKSTGIYRMFINGKLKGYGPARAAHGYVRLDEYTLPEGENNIVFEVYANNCGSYYIIDEKPYFGAEIERDGKIIADVKDFSAFYINDRIEKVQRMGFQRCFAESYNMEKDRSAFYLGDSHCFPSVSAEEVEGGKELSRNVSYPELLFIGADESFEDGSVTIDKSKIPQNKSRALNDAESFPETFKSFRYIELDECLFDEFASMVYKRNCEKKDGFYKTYDMKRALCGFFSLKCSVTKECDIYLLCDELAKEKSDYTEIDLERNSFTAGLKYHLKEGDYNLISFEAYVGRFFRIAVLGGEAEIKEFGIITYENPDTKDFSYKTENNNLNKIIEAARNTFIHNALDVLTDCPSRERAGWLCDSYFTGQAEKFFTGENKVERNFLQNIILSPQLKELPEGMLPMCYPADHANGNFIPNWSLWFILELKGYLSRTGDTELVKLAKPRVEGVLKYFEQFENEYSLLENLTGWVFVEWSPCNDESHIKGINFPSNMLYMAALKAAGELYGEAKYTNKSELMKKNIISFGFNGEFFVDNSLREGENFIRTDNITETCQYYAMFFGILTKENYPELWDIMLSKFGPERDESKVYPNVSKSNAFIGNYLRLETMLEHGYKKEILSNCENFFTYMAEKTGTLWENVGDSASLDHGFASVAAYYIYKCLE